MQSTVSRPRQAGMSLVVKRMIDWAAAAAGLLAASPLLFLAAAAICATMGAPVLFIQERPGRWGRPFRVYKFRTMREAAGPNGQPLPDAERLTRVGRLLRAMSIDELPQLWNVVSGDLSLVGPRPLLTRYLERYTPEQARRHEVLPGITGWAQVNGRNTISWEEKFALDVWYVDHWSLGLDLKILLMTIARVFQRRGVSRPGHATMPEFLGTLPGERRGERG